MNRDQSLSELRPDLGLETTHSTPVEQFQNQTLRPILKLQHELLLAVFRQHIAKYPQVYERLSAAERADWVARALQEDQRLRHRMAGLVIGHFTLAEWEQFVLAEPEYMRRLIQMLIQRLNQGL
jgi:hypothetical protein